MTFLISTLLLLASLGAGLHIRSRRGRRAIQARQRQVEQPNSSYSAPGVRRLVDLERWERIPREELHTVNRAEVDRLLRRAKTSGPDALSEEERRFLDNMVPRG